MTSDSQSESGGVVSSTAWLDRIKELDALIAPLTDERAELNRKILESKSKFKIGDIIEWNKGTRRGRVTEIRHWIVGEPMWKVRRILKDGSDGEVCEVRPYMDAVRSNAEVSDRAGNCARS
jgi:hypothetical protein